MAISVTLPACYAIVVPGLEKVAANEITKDLQGQVKMTSEGLIVFRVPEINSGLLRLRTVEDVFLLAWGTDQLSYRANDLERIRRWTEQGANWDWLLQLHHGIRPKPKGKPSYRLVSQMTGKHGYRRVDAGKALARGLAGKLPASWRPAEENAAVEIWLTIHGAQAVCGLRLSDRSMRHRAYKMEHIPASLRPTVAAAMVRLAKVKPGQVIVDPLCGAGTLLAELLEFARAHYLPDSAGEMKKMQVWGGDIDPAALRAAGANLRRLGRVNLVRWDAVRLPFETQSIDRVISNPPFGKQLAKPQEIYSLYHRLLAEFDRVLKASGQAVLLVSDFHALKQAADAVGWKLVDHFHVRVLGQPAALTSWRKVGGSITIGR
jgi:23S rRNA G2445 N2-methylase RlmL